MVDIVKMYDKGVRNSELKAEKKGVNHIMTGIRIGFSFQSQTDKFSKGLK